MSKENQVCQLSDEALDAMVKAAIQPPDGLSERIKSAVRRDAIQSARHRKRWKRWGIACIGTAAVMLLVLHIAPSSAPRAIQAVSVTQQASAPAAAQPTSAPDDSLILDIPRPQLPQQPPKAIAMRSSRSLKLVGVTGGNVKNSAPAPKGQVVLPQTIRHVWGVENTDGACKLLGDIAKANDLSLNMTGKQDNACTLTITLNDGQLQSLVDKLHGEGWQLVSPFLPQPDQANLISYNGHAVAYTISLVRN